LTVHNGRTERHQVDQTGAAPEPAEPPGEDQSNQTTSRIGRKRRTAIHVLPPAVVAMDGDDQRQAVTAIATMIAAWWHDHQHDLPE
jgi:hypothetical protein